jgi:hypothetical protein
MRALTSSACLEVWERGRRLHPLDRGLLALSFAMPEAPTEDFADWPLGRRNEALLELYCCFTGRFEAWISCPRCGEKMDLELEARDFLEESGNATRTTVIIGRREFRLPTSRDLAAVASENDLRAAASRLVERCLLKGGESAALTDAEIEHIEQQMAAADPLAEIRLSLCCPSCSFVWEESLDVATFLWAEVEVRGRRLLGEVHTHARAYGWTEAEILSLSNSRRSLYIEMNSASNAGTAQQWTPDAPGRLH